jgi:hypothetical protein
MNEYLYNYHNTQKDIVISKKPNIYRMGWKITNPKDKNINTKNMDNSSDNIDSDMYSSNLKRNIIYKYNIYEEFPEYFPEIVEQGNVDCCVPTCLSTIFYYNMFKQGNTLKFRFSRLFLYYNVRKFYDETSDDNGARIIDCIKILKNKGATPEMTHPYHEKFIYDKPNEISYKLAKYCKLLGFKQLKSSEINKNLLLNNLVICGIKVYDNFNNKNSIKTGKILNPTSNNELIGGHSIIIVGFNDITKEYTFLNSWGKAWGDDGFGYIQYDYIHNSELTDEFFILTKITNPIYNFLCNNNSLIEYKIEEILSSNNVKPSNPTLKLIKILLITILLIIHKL